MRRLIAGPLLLLLLLRVAAVAATAASDAAVLKSLRDATIGLAGERASPEAALVAAAAYPGCCEDGHLLPTIDCETNITCPILGWTTNLTAPPCSWVGVTCGADGLVTKLVLRFMRREISFLEPPLLLSAAFLELVAQLPALELFDLPGPSTFNRPARLPASWAGMRRLRKIRIFFVAMTGGLPAAWGAKNALPSLQQLVLTGCGLTGSLPSTWFSSGAFPSLQSLELGTNAFTGSLPPLVPSSLPRLARLDCSDNRLTGTLPSSWAGAMIEKIQLSNNQLSGMLPAGWAQTMPSLTHIDLRTNQLRGTLPAAWQQLGRLELLWLSRNQLSGTLPLNLGCSSIFPGLVSLDVSYNSLTGGLPHGCNLTYHIASNDSCESWPLHGIAAPTPSRLRQMIVRNNSLAGTLPVQLPCSFPVLEQLDAAFNQLSGTLPASWWGQAEGSNHPWRMSLDTMILHHNRLTGPVPSAIPAALPTRLRYLRVVDLSSNQLTRTLSSPEGGSQDGFGILHLHSLNLADNKLSGSLPARWPTSGLLTMLRALNLSGNAFTGALPSTWLVTNVWTGIHYMDVARNQLKGPVHIPAKDTKRQFSLLVWPGNNGLCLGTMTTKRPTACLNTSGIVGGWTDIGSGEAIVVQPGGYQDIPINHPDEGWTVCYNATTSVHLPACSPSVVRSSSSSRGVLAAAVGGAAVLVMAAVALLPAVRRKHAQGAAAASADEEGLQLLLQHSTGSGGTSRPPKRREHAEIERQLLDLSQHMLGASADNQGLVIGAHRPPALSALTQQLPGTASWQQEATAGDGPSTSGRASEPLRAATACGPLSLRLSDLTFSQRLPTSGSSSCAGLVEIGAGTSSKVYLARLHDELAVAVKVMLLPEGPMLNEQLQQEVSLVHRCHHPGILQLVGVCWAHGLVFVVTELMSGGSLLSQLPNPALRYHARGRELLLQVASTLHHLHGRKIVHLDLKASNVLLDGSLGTAKICDLGKSGILQASIVTAQGTPNRYSSPEQLAGDWCGPASDIYSLGIVMLEVLTGHAARGRDARAELQLRVPEHCPLAVAELAYACLDRDPTARPGAKHVVAVLQDRPA